MKRRTPSGAANRTDSTTTCCLLTIWTLLSFFARRPRPSGLGIHGALARRVV